PATSCTRSMRCAICRPPQYIGSEGSDEPRLSLIWTTDRPADTVVSSATTPTAAAPVITLRSLGFSLPEATRSSPACAAPTKLPEGARAVEPSRSQVWSATCASWLGSTYIAWISGPQLLSGLVTAGVMIAASPEAWTPGATAPR